MRVHRALACVSIVASLTVSSPCFAQTPDGPAPSDAAAPKADALPVTVKLVSTAIQAEAIRTAIETELRVPVRVEETLPDEGLSVTVKWRRTTVSYRSKQGETTTRSLDLPANAEQAVEVIALLAGNLARDEASELLARLAPPAAPEAPTATESPAPAAGAPPAPEPAAPEEKTDARPPPAEKKTAQKPKLDGLIRGNPGSLNLTLWYPLTLLDHTERRALNGELGFAYSRVGAVEGLGFTVGHLRVEKDVRGAVGTFGWTRVDGDIIGIQLGGLVNEAYGKVRGADVSEIASVRVGNVEGAQVSGLFNRAKKVTGAQMSAGFTLAEDVVGLQSGFIAVARDVQGMQVNFLGMTRDIEGAQLGLVNVARDIDGVELGLVNVARATDVQLGLVNVAERVDGAAIGLVNIAGNGAVQPTAYVIGGGGRDSLNAGVRFVAGYAYSLLAVGATEEDSKPRARAEAGGGFHLPIPLGGGAIDRGSLELGVHFGHTWFEQTDGSSEEDFLHYRGGFGLRLLRFVWLLGGYDVSHDLSPFGERVGYGPWFGLAVF